MEFAFAYLLPVSAPMGGLIWSAIFLAFSWLVATLDQLPMLIDHQGESEPTQLALLMFACSWMLGLLPHIMRLSTAHEEWDLNDALPPAEARKRWREEKRFLAKSLPSGRSLLPATLIALAIGILVNIQVNELNLDNLHHPVIAWVGIQMLLLFQLLIRGMAFTHFAKRRRKPLLEAATHVDLLDLSPQHRAARCAVRSCLSWVAGASLSSLFLLLGSKWLTQSIIAVVVVLAALSLLPTVLLMQRRIHRAKELELARFMDEVHACRDALLGQPACTSSQPARVTQTETSVQAGRLADLLSYINHIENLPELPFHKGKLAIVSLYFAVPLGSWLLVSGVQHLLGMTFS